MGGIRSYANLKYRLIKGMARRALKFKDEAKTDEERGAWSEVVDWLNSFLKPEYRITTRQGAIGLPVGIHKIEEVFRLAGEDDAVIPDIEDVPDIPEAKP
jgi:hypothetical protein